MSLNEGEGDGSLMAESSGFSTLSKDGPEELSFGLIHLLGSDIVTDAESDGIVSRITGQHPPRASVLLSPMGRGKRLVFRRKL